MRMIDNRRRNVRSPPGADASLPVISSSADCDKPPAITRQRYAAISTFQQLSKILNVK